ncbi:CHY zinc finger protein [Halopenitus sp. H-Gu1]|uniref:CHY zinc finger protein n=1 Tax=Halopenitus sp. H-Gu1 TaxID=3242697 RepID=UPI00359EC5B1
MTDPGTDEERTGGQGSDEERVRTTIEPTLDERFAVPLRGIDVDPEARCAHWHGEVDVVALRFACCETYYPCVRCHEAATDHEPVRWPRDRFGEPAVLCGSCGERMTPIAYFECGNACPGCGTAFNPGCRAHRDRYFEPDGNPDVELDGGPESGDQRRQDARDP